MYINIKANVIVKVRRKFHALDIRPNINIMYLLMHAECRLLTNKN